MLPDISWGGKMREAWHELYVHLVWSTWDRLPLLVGEVDLAARKEVARKSQEHGCHPLAIGGVEEHLHVLLGFPPTLTISGVVKGLKGSSSHLVAQAIRPCTFFRWQGGYGAFTVRKSDVPVVRQYILDQRDRHHRGALLSEFERFPVKPAEAGLVRVGAVSTAGSGSR
jgi:putative transposase